MKTQTEFRVGWESEDVVLDKIRVAKAIAALDHETAKSLLNDLFRSGVPPEFPIEGRFGGDLVLLNIAPGLNPILRRLADTWMPWQGKTLNADENTGENIFTCDSLKAAHLLFPFYHHIVDDGPTTFRAFAFHTRLGPGKSDPDRTVLKIDYGLPENPRLTVRRMLDELVRISDNLYLGKAHMQWWWGKWQTVAFFTLARQRAEAEHRHGR